MKISGFLILLTSFMNLKTAQTVPKQMLQKPLRSTSFNMAIFNDECGVEFSVARYHPASSEGSFPPWEKPSLRDISLTCACC